MFKYNVITHFVHSIVLLQSPEAISKGLTLPGNISHNVHSFCMFHETYFPIDSVCKKKTKKNLVLASSSLASIFGGKKGPTIYSPPALCFLFVCFVLILRGN